MSNSFVDAFRSLQGGKWDTWTLWNDFIGMMAMDDGQLVYDLKG